MPIGTGSTRNLSRFTLPGRWATALEPQAQGTSIANWVSLPGFAATPVITYRRPQKGHSHSRVKSAMATSVREGTLV